MSPQTRPDLEPGKGIRAPRFEDIPRELRTHPHWAVWRGEPRDNGKISKPPRNPQTRQLARVNEPATFGPYEDAKTAYEAEAFDGVGILLTVESGIVGFDIDDARETVVSTPGLQEWLRSAKDLGVYTEVSPSGRGLRLFAFGTLPSRGRRKGKLETYSRERFLTVTGHGRGRIIAAQGLIDDFLSIIDQSGLLPNPSPPQSNIVPLYPSELRPALVAEIAAAVRDARPELWAGDWQQPPDPEWGVGQKPFPSQSEADLSLMNTVAHVAIQKGVSPQHMAPVMDAVFQQSGLVRPKYVDRQDYRSSLIQRALDPKTAGGPQIASSPQSDEKHSPPIKHVDLSDIDSAMVPGPEFVITPILPRGEVTLFSSHGGTGKSSLALTMATHVALGERWAGLRVEQGGALFASLEDSGPLLRFRLRRVLEVFGFVAHARALKSSLDVLDCSEAPPLMTETSNFGVRSMMTTTSWAEIEAQARRSRPALIVIDNASDAFDGDENNRRQVRAFFKVLKRLARELHAAILLLAHIDKMAARKGGDSSANSYSGSTAWHNSARSRLTLIKDELLHEKLNVGRVLDIPIPLVWYGPVPVPDPGGYQRAATRSAAQAEDDVAVLAAITAVTSEGGTVSTATSGSATTWHGICARPELPPELREDTREAKRRVHEAAARLVSRGSLAAETYKGRNRHKRERWVVNPLPPQGGASVRESCASAPPEQPQPLAPSPAPVQWGGMGDRRAPPCDTPTDAPTITTSIGGDAP